MEIDTGDHPPISRKHYLTTLAEKVVENMLRDGIISLMVSEC